MRLLRALVHLVLALALVTATAAQARAVSVVASPHAAHEAMAAGHADHAPAHPLHKREACQTVCCFTPAQVGARADGTSSPASYGAVHYADLAQPLSGRLCAPDPDIPKHAA